MSKIRAGIEETARQRISSALNLSAVMSNAAIDGGHTPTVIEYGLHASGQICSLFSNMRT